MLVPLLTSSFMLVFVACQSMTPTATEADHVFPLLATNHHSDLQASFSAEPSFAYHASSEHSISSVQSTTYSTRILELSTYASSVDSLTPFTTILTASSSKDFNIENLHTSVITKTKSQLDSYSSEMFLQETTEQTNQNENIFDMLKRSWIDGVEEKNIDIGVIAENISNSENDAITLATSSVQTLYNLKPSSFLFSNYIGTNSETITQSSVPQRQENTIATDSSSSSLFSYDDFYFGDFNIIGDTTTEELALHASTIYDSGTHIVPSTVETSHSQNIANSEEKFGAFNKSDSFIHAYGSTSVSDTGSTIYQSREESTVRSFQENNPNIYSTVIFNAESEILSPSLDIVASAHEKLTTMNGDVITEVPDMSSQSEMVHGNVESSEIYGSMSSIQPSSSEVTKTLLSTEPSVASEFWFAGLMPNSDETFEQSQLQKWSLNLPNSRYFSLIYENVPSADVVISSFAYRDIMPSDFIAAYPRDQQLLSGDKDMPSFDYSMSRPGYQDLPSHCSETFTVLHQDLPSHYSETSTVLHQDLPFHYSETSTVLHQDVHFEKSLSSEQKFYQNPSSSEYEFQIYSSLSDFENYPSSSDYEFNPFSNDYVFNPYPSDYEFYLFSKEYEFNPSSSDFDFNPSSSDRDIAIDKYPSSSEHIFTVDVLSTRKSQDLSIASHISVPIVSIQRFDLSSHTSADLKTEMHPEVRPTAVFEYDVSSQQLAMNLSQNLLVHESVSDSTMVVNPILREFGTSVQVSDEIKPELLSTYFTEGPLTVQISPSQIVGSAKSETYQDSSLSNSSFVMNNVLRSSMEENDNNSVSIKTVDPILQELGSSLYISDEMEPEILNTDFQEWPISVQTSPAQTNVASKSSYWDDSLYSISIPMFNSNLKSSTEGSYNMPNSVNAETVIMSSVYAHEISLETMLLSDVSSFMPDTSSETTPERWSISGGEQLYRSIDNVQPTSEAASIKSTAYVSSHDSMESNSLYQSVSAANYLSSETNLISLSIMSSFHLTIESVLETPSLYPSTKSSSLPEHIGISEWIYYESLTDPFVSLQDYETEFTEVLNTNTDSSSIIYNDNLISSSFFSSTLDGVWNPDMGNFTDYGYITMSERAFASSDLFTESSDYSTIANLHHDETPLSQNVIPSSEYNMMSSSRSVNSSHLTNVPVAISLANVTVVPARSLSRTDLQSLLITDATNNAFRTLDTTTLATFLPALTTILPMGSTSEFTSNIVATKSWSNKLETVNLIANDVSVDEHSLELLPETLLTSLFLPASESLPLILDLTVADSMENDVSAAIVSMSQSVSEPPGLLYISLYEPPFFSESVSSVVEIISTSVEVQQTTEPNSVDILPSSTLIVDSMYSMSFVEESISGPQSLTGSDVILQEGSQIDSFVSSDSLTFAFDTVDLSLDPFSTEMASSFHETVITDFETDLFHTSFLDTSLSSEIVLSTPGETLNASLVIDKVVSTEIMTSVDMVNRSLISDETRAPTQSIIASESLIVEVVSSTQDILSSSNDVINASLVSDDIPSTRVLIQATNVCTASVEQTMSNSVSNNTISIPMPSNSSDIIEITIDPSSSVLNDSLITDTRVVETFVTLVCFETMVILDSPLPDEIQMSMFTNASSIAKEIQSSLFINASAMSEEFASTIFVDVVSLSDVIQSSIFNNASVLVGENRSSIIIDASVISEDVPSITFVNVSSLSEYIMPSIFDNSSSVPEEIQPTISINATVISEEIPSSMFVDIAGFSEDTKPSVFDNSSLHEEIQSSIIINATVISDEIPSTMFVNVSLSSNDTVPSVFDNSSSLPEQIQSSMNVDVSATSAEIRASFGDASSTFATPLMTMICMNITYLSNDTEFETTNVSAVETTPELQSMTFVQNTSTSTDEVTSSLKSLPSIEVLITELPSSDLLPTFEATSTQMMEGTILPALSSDELLTPTTSVDSVVTPPLTTDFLTSTFPVDIVTSVPKTEEIFSLISSSETIPLGTTFDAISQSPTVEDITTAPATDLLTLPGSTTESLITAFPLVEETIASTMEDIITQAPGTEIVTTQMITTENILSTPIVVDTITESPTFVETIMASPASRVEETITLSSMVEDILSPSPTIKDVIEPSSATENVLATNRTAAETNGTSTIVTETIKSSPLIENTSIPSITTIEQVISTSSTEAVASSSVLVLVPAVSTPMPLLNMSEAFVAFYIVTVIKVLPTDDITTVLFLTTMEGRLAAAYVEAFKRGEQILNGTYKPLKRRKRYVQVEDVAVQMINVTRTANSNNVSLLYYMEKNGTAVPAKNAVQHLNLFTDQELALRLGYVVHTRATAYVPEPVPPDSKLWIIGAVIGGIMGLLVVLWCILCIYFKCCRRRESKTPRGVSEPHLVRVKTPEGMAYSGPRPVLEHQDVAIEKSNGNANMGSPKRQLYQVNHPEDHADPVYARVQKSPRHSPKHDQRSPGDVSTDGEHTVVYISEQGEVKAHKKRPRKQRKSKPHTDVEAGNVEERMQMSAQSVITAQPARVPTPRRQVPRPNKYEADSDLQQRSEIERWRNKQRLREKKKGSKKDKLEPLDQTSEDYKAYLKSQDEDGLLLSDTGNTEKSIPDVFLQPPSRSPKKHRKSRKKHDTVGHVYENESFLDSETPISTGDQDTVSAARFRMHQLLDDAFTLLTPNQSDSSGNKVQPEPLSPSSDSSSRPVPAPRQNTKSRGKHRKHDRNSPESSDRDSARAYGEQDTLPIQEKKHTPIYLKGLSSASHTGLPGDDPYKAADESSLISLPHKQTNGHDGGISPYHDKLFTTTFTQKLPNSIQPTTEANRSIVEKMNGSIHTKYNITTKSEKMNGHMLSHSTSKINGDVKYYDLDSALGPTKISSSGSKKGSADLVEMNVLKRGKADRDDIDIIKDSIEPGSSPTPLIQSIRSELLRLSNKSPENEKNMFLYGQR